MLFDDLPRELLRAARRFLHLNSITLFVPSLPKGFTPPVLVQEGSSAAPPELVDIQAAQAFHDSRKVDPADELAQSVAVGSAHSDCTLIRISTSAIAQFFIDEDPHEGLNRRSKIDPEIQYPPVWIGIRHDPGQRDPVQVGPQLLTAFAGLLAWQVARVAKFERDPLTGLPERSELQARLSHEVTVSRASGRALSVFLIKPDHFEALTERVGRSVGDTVLCEIADRITASGRKSDLTARFTKQVFAVGLPSADATAASAVARKLLAKLTEKPYSAQGQTLTFSLGMATFDPSVNDLRPSDLILRADQALVLAQRSGGNCGLEWQKFAQNETFEANSLSSVFTGEASRDARNLLLFSELVKVVSLYEKPERVSSHFIDRLYSSMSPGRVALFEWDDSGNVESYYGRRRSPPGEEAPLFDQAEVQALTSGILERARDCRRFQNELVEGANEEGLPSAANVYALPLIVGGSCIGCLYFEEADVGPELDSADLQMLRSLTSHLAAALSRARLIEIERQRAEKARQQLEGEVEGLRRVITESGLTHRSSAMEKVLAIVDRVATTDVTVLVTGESGVGKGVVSRTIHQLSKRKTRPLVVVDCASVPTSLIESELFGHERGAFTGAHKRFAGRLREAHQGTVFLDEIGELPLEVQGKLLRFVQERTLTPLGSTKSYEVDVRIIAATNRDLKEEVAHGRFREDLYYRLNVLPIAMPPLRDRTDDIPELVNHFLKKYSMLYNRTTIARCAPGVMVAIAAHGWPGNIRELENRVQQAVVLGGDELTAADFSLDDGSLSPEVETFEREPEGSSRDDDSVGWMDAQKQAEPLPLGIRVVEQDAPTEEASFDHLLARLGEELQRLLRGYGGRDKDQLDPVGIWLETELILAAHEKEGGVERRAAALVGLPGTTYKRRFEKAKKRGRLGEDGSNDWTRIRHLLTRLLDTTASAPDTSLITEIQALLLLEIIEEFPGDNTSGASLLGVTPVTFRRRARALEARVTDSRS